MLRIRGRTLRDESLETNTARDLIQGVRMFVEMDVGPVSPSSTTWYEKKRSETNHWTGVTQGTWNKSCGYYGKWTSFLLFRVRMPRIYKDVRHRAQKWNVGLERRKERETFCGRLRKRTPFLRWRAQLHDTRKSGQKRITGKSFTVRRIWALALQFA